jgi:hypothetical protein
MGGGHHERGHSVGIARVDGLGARGQKQGEIALRVQKARTCGVMGGEEADAVFMVESGCKKHGSDGGGIHRRLHVVCRAVVEQSGNARRFSWGQLLRQTTGWGGSAFAKNQREGHLQQRRGGVR